MSVARSIGCFLTTSVLVFGASLAVAEPTTGAIQLDQVRPYIGGNTVFVYPHGQGPCSGSGALNIYTIDLSTSSGKAAYAAALAAITAGKMVMLEVIAGQCGSSYPALQSIYSLPN